MCRFFDAIKSIDPCFSFRSMVSNGSLPTKVKRLFPSFRWTPRLSVSTWTPFTELNAGARHGVSVLLWNPNALVWFFGIAVALLRRPSGLEPGVHEIAEGFDVALLQEAAPDLGSVNEAPLPHAAAESDLGLSVFHQAESSCGVLLPWRVSN